MFNLFKKKDQVFTKPCYTEECSTKKCRGPSIFSFFSKPVEERIKCAHIEKSGLPLNSASWNEKKKKCRLIFNLLDVCCGPTICTDKSYR